MNTFQEYKDALREKVLKIVCNKITFKERFTHMDIEEILLVVKDYTTETDIAEQICNNILDNMDLVDIDGHNYKFIRELFILKSNIEYDRNSISLDEAADEVRDVNEHLERLGDY